MKRTTHPLKQHGFFDLGFSLIILAIAGTTTAVVNTDNNETSIAQQEQQEITTEAAPLEQLANYDSDDC